jgi:hypothetical protein
MEPRTPTNAPNPGFPDTVLDYYDFAYALAMRYYKAEVERVRKLRFEDCTPDQFWSEYIWCVYVSGFNSKVIAQKHPALRDAYGDWRNIGSYEAIWMEVKPVIANERKCKAVHGVGVDMSKAWYWAEEAKAEPNAWWLKWRSVRCANLELIQGLPFMGPVTSHHLARNLGLDTVKPDLHLNRLANLYQFYTTEAMCRYIAINRPVRVSPLRRERLGVIDLILWYGASTWGTTAIKDAKLGR